MGQSEAAAGSGGLVDGRVERAPRAPYRSGRVSRTIPRTRPPGCGSEWATR